MRASIMRVCVWVADSTDSLLLLHDEQNAGGDFPNVSYGPVVQVNAP